MTKKGRPTKYTPKLAEEICERISRGELAVEICELEDMPDWSTVWRWMEAYPDFRNAYIRAREVQMMYFADITVRQSRDNSKDYQTNETQIVKEDGTIITKKEVRSDNTAVQRHKLICDNLWRLMSCLNKTFAPKQDVEHSGNVTVTPVINVSTKTQ